jgi:hypothetical protein
MGRFSRLRQIQQLDPERDYEQIFLLCTRYEFPWDYSQGVAIAFLRDYGVPSVSRLLAHTAEFAEHGQKRYDDTQLFGYEAVDQSMESAHGRAGFRRLNRVHGHYDIPNEDFRYVLATLVVGPIRWLRRYGWRPLSEHEVQGITLTMVRYGELMGIKDLPADYPGFEELFQRTERERFAFDEANRRVAVDTLRIFANWFPRPLRGLAARAVVALLDEPLRLALGLPEESPLLKYTVDRAVFLRGKIVRRLPARPDTRPWRPKPRTYPFGWSLNDLGPAGMDLPAEQSAKEMAG